MHTSDVVIANATKVTRLSIVPQDPDRATSLPCGDYRNQSLRLQDTLRHQRLKNETEERHLNGGLSHGTGCRSQVDTIATPPRRTSFRPEKSIKLYCTYDRNGKMHTDAETWKSKDRFNMESVRNCDVCFAQRSIEKCIKRNANISKQTSEHGISLKRMQIAKTRFVAWLFQVYCIEWLNRRKEKVPNWVDRYVPFGYHRKN